MLNKSRLIRARSCPCGGTFRVHDGEAAFRCDGPGHYGYLRHVHDQLARAFAAARPRGKSQDTTPDSEQDTSPRLTARRL
jgi:hypothetical protein